MCFCAGAFPYSYSLSYLPQQKLSFVSGERRCLTYEPGCRLIQISIRTNNLILLCQIAVRHATFRSLYPFSQRWRQVAQERTCTPTLHVLWAPSLPPSTMPIAASDWFNRSRTRSAVALSHIPAWGTGPLVRDPSPPLTEAQRM